MLNYLLTLIEDEGDKERFVSLFHQYNDRLHRVALQILREPRDAEDAVQNTFLQVLKHFQKINEIPCEELPFWLVSIVKNEAVTIRRKRDRVLLLEDWDAVAGDVNAVQDHQGVLALVQCLPESYRAVLEMKYVLRYTDQEIARHLGLSETAVSSRASRGRALLRQLLEKEGIYP